MNLLVHQSLWAMEALDGPGQQRPTLEAQVERVAEAGFDGVNAEIQDRERASYVSDLVGQHGLSWSVLCEPRTVAEAEPIVAAAVEFGAREIHLQPNMRTARLEEAVALVRGWQKLAHDAGMPLHFETHRDRMTNDLHFTLALIDSLPDIDLAADLSHFVVAREMQLPLSAENREMMQRILDRAAAFHGRVASCEQIQVQLDFPQHGGWLDLFAGLWEQGFRTWRARANEDDELIFVTELGPPPYAITGPDGKELSDRWQEALQLKDLARDTWARL